MVLDIAWIALSLLPSLGNKTLTTLIETFGSSENILAAEREALMAVRGVGSKIAASINNIELAKIEEAIADWQKAGVRIVPQHDPDYPPILLTIPDPPLTLFMLGNYQTELWERSVAIVGTRNPSRDAARLAKQLGAKLAAEGWTIVSGLALGIDRMAHEGALSNPEGRSIAVLGGGILNIYPPQNQKLAEQLLTHGLILSENHPLATPKATRLVIRNRIISGLCQHIIVVETALDGGAMYAARAASNQGRKIHSFDFAVTGNQYLLANGADCLDMQHPRL